MRCGALTHVVELAQDLGVQGPVVVYDWQSGEAREASTSSELRPTTGAFTHRYVVLAPVLANGLALIGERDKYVTLADKRLERVEVSGETIELTLGGAPGEQVELLTYDTRSSRLLTPLLATLDVTGRAEVSIRR